MALRGEHSPIARAGQQHGNLDHGTHPAGSALRAVAVAAGSA
jgi:hypothetical protein